MHRGAAILVEAQLVAVDIAKTLIWMIERLKDVVESTSEARKTLLSCATT